MRYNYKSFRKLLFLRVYIPGTFSGKYRRSDFDPESGEIRKTSSSEIPIKAVFFRTVFCPFVSTLPVCLVSGSAFPFPDRVFNNGIDKKVNYQREESRSK